MNSQSDFYEVMPEEKRKFSIPEGHTVFVQTGLGTYNKWIMKDGRLEALEGGE